MRAQLGLSLEALFFIFMPEKDNSPRQTESTFFVFATTSLHHPMCTPVNTIHFYEGKITKHVISKFWCYFLRKMQALSVLRDEASLNSRYHCRVFSIYCLGSLETVQRILPSSTFCMVVQYCHFCRRENNNFESASFLGVTKKWRKFMKWGGENEIIYRKMQWSLNTGKMD